MYLLYLIVLLFIFIFLQLNSLTDVYQLRFRRQFLLSFFIFRIQIELVLFFQNVFWLRLSRLILLCSCQSLNEGLHLSVAHTWLRSFAFNIFFSSCNSIEVSFDELFLDLNHLFIFVLLCVNLFVILFKWQKPQNLIFIVVFLDKDPIAECFVIVLIIFQQLYTLRLRKYLSKCSILDSHQICCYQKSLVNDRQFEKARLHGAQDQCLFEYYISILISLRQIIQDFLLLPRFDFLGIS